MKLISIIVPEQGTLATISDTRKFFRVVNELLIQEGGQPEFKVELVGFRKEILLEGESIIVKVDSELKNTPKSDLIIIPALEGDVIRATQLNKRYYSYILEQYKNGAEVASYCVGAFILAATGLLDGKRCSTHWMYANEFRTYYPKVNLMDDRIINEQNGIFSSGGGTSYWNLLLYWLEKYTSRRIVIAITKHFLLDIERRSQTSFMMFVGQKEHDDELIKKVQTYIEAHYKDKLNIEAIAKRFAIVRRTLERRFQRSTNNSIADYIHRIKVEAAKREIELTRKSITETMHELGYSDPKTFRDLFTKYAGITPGNYKKRYGLMSGSAAQLRTQRS